MIKLENYLNESESTPKLSGSVRNFSAAVNDVAATAVVNTEDVDYDEVREEMKTVVDRVEMSQVDIAPTRDEYRNLAWALQDAFGSSEEGYDLFLRLSHLWSDPRAEHQTDGDIRMQWLQFLRSNKFLGQHSSAGISFRTFFKMAMDKGIDIITN